jgi:hypothetical protein
MADDLFPFPALFLGSQGLKRWPAMRDYLKLSWKSTTCVNYALANDSVRLSDFSLEQSAICFGPHVKEQARERLTY